MKTCIIGGGWYGCHLARKLSSAGHDVTLVEKNADIFSGISGSFGIRLHAGPHYPRSPKTRESCQRAFNKFIQEYESLVVRHDYSMYAIGDLDSFNFPSKVNLDAFKAICAETQIIAETENPKNWGYQNLQYIANIFEPSISLGKRLRLRFKDYLAQYDIKFLFNANITRLNINNHQVTVCSGERIVNVFDLVINTSSYQSEQLILNKVQLPFQPKYQTCMGLLYQDKLADNTKPFSFIVMDGFFPCIMPYADEPDAVNANSKKYLLTHGQWTNLGTFDNPADARLLLNSITANDIAFIKSKCEEAISRYWPMFKDRFQYLSWKGTVLVKLLTDVEFRSAVTYAENKQIIHVVPGKVTNIFDVEEEIYKLINLNEQEIIQKEGYYYVKNGVLDDAMTEITKKPKERDSRNTCFLQTYRYFKPDFIPIFNNVLAKQDEI